MNQQIWAMAPATLRDFLSLKIDAATPLPESAGQPKSRKEKSIAVLSLHGVMEARTTLRGYLFGGTSTMAFGRAFDAAMEDSSVGGILIDVDSPGGSVFGTQELAAKIYSARGAKPIVAIANPQADSAAFWVGTAADRLYVTPSGRVGSVGTLATHQDWSEAYAKAGVKEHVVVSTDSPFKGEWIDSQPASPEYLADLQSMVNEYQSNFVSAVAQHRGATMTEVRQKFGKGRDVGAKAAVENGMADGIATFEVVASKMIEGRMRLRRAQASTRRLREIVNKF